ncbi:MAG: phytoene/squalene synthase family protein [Bacteroidia bacterium]
MRILFDQISHATSKNITRTYSTSFSMAIALLENKIQQDVYNIYGFVRLADEIVDTFHDQDKEKLLTQMIEQTWEAIEMKFSLNPVLYSFQETVHRYQIDHELIRLFLESMEMDLNKHLYDQAKYEKYIVGSAEVVGLMCLKVFCYGNQESYDALRYSASRLGAAFQKINFLRDLKADYEGLGRTYFPNVSFSHFDEKAKREIEEDIEKDFQDGFEGIKQLPKGSRFGVYVAYIYYYNLFDKIKKIHASRIMEERIRISDRRKYSLFMTSYIRNQIGFL